MSIFLIVLAFILIIVGLVGTFIPMFPGLPIGWLGLFVAFFSTKCNLSIWTLVITLLLMVIITVLDYFIPARMVKKSGGTKSGERGAIIGSLSGIIFVNPIILIFGSFIGALIGEIINDSKDMKKALKSAFSSFVGFLLGTGIKAFLTLSFLLILILNLVFGLF
ncbi:MAG: DUF456 domain-containing protein [Elusimicrobia bacterium]|nr:DUF456 domain-containing protein [Elusimicrobiota bacterium]